MSTRRRSRKTTKKVYASKGPRKSRRSRKTRKEGRATMSESLTDLQLRARSLGIPFGGLSKQLLIDKINRNI